jgi:hypothetical protein
MKDEMAPSKVTVKGTGGDTMGGMETFSVRSIKVVAKSCS